MRRTVALLLLAASLAVQANALSCPMTGDAMPVGQAVADGPAAAGGGSHHRGHGASDAAPHGHVPSAPAAHAGGSGSLPPDTGGCGALMACGLAAAPAAPAAPRLPLATSPVRMAASLALVSAAGAPVELPPPRA